MNRIRDGKHEIAHATFNSKSWCSLGGVGLLLVILLALLPGKPAAHVAETTAPDSLGSLLAMDADQLSRVDIARASLLIAEGLSGSENIDLQQALATLDDWASTVRAETERHLYKFRQNPAEYNHSEPYFRVLMLVTVLQQDMKVRYNPARASDPDFRDSRDLFIHGFVHGGNGGTCASMPVLYVALGRRLSYPLKLVAAKAHLFARWDDGKERFNIEATNDGLTTPADEYYKSWPLPITEDEAPYYLKSMTPADEFAALMAIRGDCFDANGRLAEAAAAFAAACRLAPSMLPYRVAHRTVASKSRTEHLFTTRTSIRPTTDDGESMRTKP